MSGDVQPYLDLITSEHQTPNFLEVIQALTQGQADNQDLLRRLTTDYFDVYVAIGVQLDAVGLWVGISRYLTEPITGVFFAFDTEGVGFDQGTWWEPFNPLTELIRLPDDGYRTLILFKIAANEWDGTIPGAYTIFSTLLSPLGFTVLIQDNDDMTMIEALLGVIPDALTQALFSVGELALKPAGVMVTFMLPSLADTPYFGFDVENSSISGFDVGAWGLVAGTD